MTLLDRSQETRKIMMRCLHQVQEYRAVLDVGWQKMPFASCAFSLSSLMHGEDTPPPGKKRLKVVQSHRLESHL